MALGDEIFPAFSTKLASSLHSLGPAVLAPSLRLLASWQLESVYDRIFVNVDGTGATDHRVHGLFSSMRRVMALQSLTVVAIR